jgi:dipeptidyl-peptidase-3
MYGQAIERIVSNLQAAKEFAETPSQAKSLGLLIEYYQTGDLRKFDEYSIEWVKDTEAVVDTINGFIEVYNDPMGRKGSWEAVVSIKDLELTKKFKVIGDEAAWFESHSPIMDAHKKAEVRGISYKVINVVMEGGDSSPSTPIGINLPNADWIRAQHGSKSVSLSNIEDAYEEAAKKSGALDEFYLLDAQKEAIRKWGPIVDKLTTGLHEVVGHASGQIEEGVGSPSETLKSYASCLEEARADLVALYYIGDEFLVQKGLIPTTDVVKAEYDQYVTGGMVTQLARIELGKTIEEAHMRNRALISRWVYEKGLPENVIERRDITAADGSVKTYFVVNDHGKLRTLLGALLREVQRIKSQGDYEAGKALVENYGVQIDPELHKQVKRRWDALKLSPYSGFINPTLKLQKDREGNIQDVLISYPEDFSGQMLEYSRLQSFLPTRNYTHK